MAISPRAAANQAAAAAPIANATTGPYTLAAAQATGYSGGGSVQSGPIAGVAPSINIPVGTAPMLSYSMNIPTVQSMVLGGGDAVAGSKSGGGGNAYPTIVSPTVKTPNAATTQKFVATPGIASAVQGYKNFFTSSGGDRNTYNSSVKYDTLSSTNKRIADNVYSSTSAADKKRKDYEDKKRLSIGPVDTAALIETPEQEKNRLLLDTATTTKKNADDARNAYLLQQNQAEQLQKAEADRSMGEVTAEGDKYTLEQQDSAKKFEDNRLNQVRGDIMQTLSARGVDISKLSPEQITALSGEQGVKAFGDIYSAKENAKTNIKNARDKSLAEIQRLRGNKNISTTAYNAQVVSINEITNEKLLQADNAYKNGIIGLMDKKIDTNTAVSTAIMNTLHTLGIPMSSQAAFADIAKNAKTPGEAYTAMMTSTDPKVQAAYKENEAKIAEAAKQAYNVDLLRASPKQDTPNERVTNYLKLADYYQSIDPVTSGKYRDAANALSGVVGGTTIPGTPGNGAVTVAPPRKSQTYSDSMIPNPFTQFAG